MTLEIINDSTGKKFFLPNNDTICETIKQNGSWEGHLVNLYYHFIKEGDVVVDIGANIGYHSIHFGNIVKTTGKVISFEPQKVIYDILSANILINGLSNTIQQNNLGLSSNEEIMYISDIKDVSYESGLINYGGVKLTDSNNGTSSITVKQLDDIIEESVDFIKMDIEGMEYAALQGATKVIQNSLPVIFIEMTKDQDEIISFLKQNNYTIFNILNHGNKNDYVCFNNENHVEFLNNFHKIAEKCDTEINTL